MAVTKPTDLFNQRWTETTSDVVRRTMPQHRVVQNFMDRPRNLQLFHECEWEFSSTSIAIIGGGPSLKKTIAEADKFRGYRMACGSAHAWLTDEGIDLDFSVIYDPDESEALFYKQPQEHCWYFVASHCHPKVFETLRGFHVWVWHAAGDLSENETSEPMVGGGSMVTLRAFPLAAIMGFTHIHFFGLDSSFEDGKEYAYDQTQYGAYVESPTIIHRTIAGRTFSTDRAFSFQADQFMAMLDKYGEMFRVTVHGDGMIAAMMRERR